MCRNLRRGRVWEGVSPSDGGDFFFGFEGIKTSFLVGKRLKITSTLAPNVHNYCTIRGTVFSCWGIKTRF